MFEKPSPPNPTSLSGSALTYKALLNFNSFIRYRLHPIFIIDR